jgi:uncharacterized membrane-anchored protein YitT (DUF2179 family)
MTQTHNKTAHFVQDIVYMVVGVFFAGFALRSILVPNSFLDGGVTGASLLLHELYEWPLSLVIILTNIPFIIMGYFFGRKKLCH